MDSYAFFNAAILSLRDLMILSASACFMNKEQLRSLLAQNGELSEALLPECCGPAWQLLEEGGEAAGAALTLLCRAAKKELCREALAAADHTPLRETLRADVPKQRKNAARLIGLLGRAEDTQALVEDVYKRQGEGHYETALSTDRRRI